LKSGRRTRAEIARRQEHVMDKLDELINTLHRQGEVAC
jgi:hypothetical protein